MQGKTTESTLLSQFEPICELILLMRSETSQILSRDVLKAANISPDTFLATDFLNHYNEVAMLVDFLPGDEEITSEILDWQPEGYVDHFASSGFRDKDLAIEAYQSG